MYDEEFTLLGLWRSVSFDLVGISGLLFRESHRSSCLSLPQCRDMMPHLGVGSPPGNTNTQLLPRHQVRFPTGCVRTYCVTLPSKIIEQDVPADRHEPHNINPNCPAMTRRQDIGVRKKIEEAEETEITITYYANTEIRILRSPPGLQPRDWPKPRHPHPKPFGGRRLGSGLCLWPSRYPISRICVALLFSAAFARRSS